MKAIYAIAISCYYDTADCTDDLWQCQTCQEWFCDNHSHETSLGCCVECIACERDRVKGYPQLKEQPDDQSTTIQKVE